jgi:ribosomal protein S18
MIYKGNYKTKLRIKLGENFSNEFYGTINYRQFESLFDSNGEYKKRISERKKIKPKRTTSVCFNDYFRIFLWKIRC